MVATTNKSSMRVIPVRSARHGGRSHWTIVETPAQGSPSSLTVHDSEDRHSHDLKLVAFGPRLHLDDALKDARYIRRARMVSSTTCTSRGDDPERRRYRDRQPGVGT